MDEEKKGIVKRVSPFEVRDNWMKAYTDTTFYSDRVDHWAYVQKADKTFQKFIWDPSKNALNMKTPKNPQKPQGAHGLPLFAGVTAYFDEFAIEVYDDKHTKYDFTKEGVKREERYQLVGLADEILFVSCTEPEGKKEVRLISVRKADGEERKMYNENKNQMLGIEPTNEKRDSRRRPPEKGKNGYNDNKGNGWKR